MGVDMTFDSKKGGSPRDTVRHNARRILGEASVRSIGARVWSWPPCYEESLVCFAVGDTTQWRLCSNDGGPTICRQTARVILCGLLALAKENTNE
jgi:hypothetical protein